MSEMPERMPVCFEDDAADGVFHNVEYVRADIHDSTISRLTREIDEARAEAERIRSKQREARPWLQEAEKYADRMMTGHLSYTQHILKCIRAARRALTEDGE